VFNLHREARVENFELNPKAVDRKSIVSKYDIEDYGLEILAR
ncbi:hypothetical protein TorRG33x02_126100, partial [Trema orientale]